MNESLESLLKKVPLGSESVFPKAEFDHRVSLVQEQISKKKIDLLLLSGAENIFYLSGQQTPGYYTFQCLCVPKEGAPFHVVRGLESMNARANTYLEDIVGYDDADNPAAALAGALIERGYSGKRVAIDCDGWFLTVNLYNQLVEDFGSLLDGSGIVESLRPVKSTLELEQIDKASEANDAGMKAGIDTVRVGVTENDVAAEIMRASIAAGGEYVGMEPFVTSGPRSGLPHSTWRRRPIVEGDVVVLETAACFNRYHAARFQTLFVGGVPELAEDMFKVCEEGLEAALEQMKPGNRCATPHEACQAVIDRHGFTAGFRKRTGYGMGISFAPDWGEGHILSLYRDVDVELRPGMVFHIPITLREYAKFTVAISETVVITESGNRVLSRLPRGVMRL
ncbi:MAG: Xaa-Pro peptidase family protein [Rhodospirillales bacterium]|nr:Xaa-Pro peptidase family protein [Rhodospirillales bacterium]